jgi:hypothetical protein
MIELNLNEGDLIIEYDYAFNEDTKEEDRTLFDVGIVVKITRAGSVCMVWMNDTELQTYERRHASYLLDSEMWVKAESP